MIKIIAFLLLFLAGFTNSLAQDLFSFLDSLESEKPVINYEAGTFKSVRLINGYTTELTGDNELVFSISHRFNSLKSGIHNLYGIDESIIRFGFEYGLNDYIDLGIGRSSSIELYDGFIKLRLARQSSGVKNFPVNIAWIEGMAVTTMVNINKEIAFPITARLNYVHELLISRKFNEKLSLQLVPVIVHRNRVQKKSDKNLTPAIGLGGRYKITNRFTLNTEYYYVLPQQAESYHNSLAIGVSIETGGHVFQIQLSNTEGMTEKVFVPETKGNWLDGNIHLGFNIMRVFNLNNKRK